MAAIADATHLDHHLAERLSCKQALHRVVAVGQPVLVAVRQLEPLAVLGHRRAELLDAGHPVKGQGRCVGPGDGLVGIDEDHPVVQRSDDLLQLRPVGLRGRDVVGHGP